MLSYAHIIYIFLIFQFFIHPIVIFYIIFIFSVTSFTEMASLLQSLMWKLERGDGTSELAIFVLIVFLL